MANRYTTGSLVVRWSVDSDVSRVVFEGQIDGSTDLVALSSQLDGTVLMDLERVSFVNSAGVSRWIRMVETLRERGQQLNLSRCSEAMVQQMNVIIAASGAPFSVMQQDSSPPGGE